MFTSKFDVGDYLSLLICILIIIIVAIFLVGIVYFLLKFVGFLLFRLTWLFVVIILVGLYLWVVKGKP